MKLINFLAGLSLSVLLSACAAFQGAGHVTQGREAMFAGRVELPSAYFQDAERSGPRLRIRHGAAGGSVRAVLGRAQYLTGNYPQARQTLEKALSQDKDDNVARLSLGLRRLARASISRVCKISNAGMKGIYDYFVNYITDNFRFFVWTRLGSGTRHTFRD